MKDAFDLDNDSPEKEEEEDSPKAEEIKIEDISKLPIIT